MKLCALLLCTFTILTVSVTASSQRILKESVVSEGNKHTYYLFVPENLQPSSPAPLVVLLHGSGRNGLSLVEKWKDLATTERIIIVGPDSINSTVWSIPNDGPVFLRDLVESIKRKYPVDTKRVYLFGHSGGAGFALFMSVYESEYFAATAIHAGSFRPQDMSLIDLAKRKIPIYIQVGDRDPLFPVTDVRFTRDAFNARGFSVELTEIPHHDHWYYDLAPKINLAAWEFLKKHQLTTEARFEDHNFRREGARTSKASEQYNRGIERQRAGDLAGAITAYTRSIEIEPGFGDAYNNRGIAYFGVNNLAAAVADFSRSIELKPSESAYNNRGGAYITLGKIKEAIADFTEAIRLKPTAETYYNRGAAYEHEGQPDSALADYTHAIELDPRLARAYAFRGINLLRRGETQKAQQDLDKAFALDPKLRAEFETIITQINARRGPD
jgi:tetratricopeptide (TPR) repeat protein